MLGSNFCGWFLQPDGDRAVGDEENSAKSHTHSSACESNGPDRMKVSGN